MDDSPREILARRLEPLDLEIRQCRNKARMILIAAVLRDEVDYREAKAIGEIIRDAGAELDEIKGGEGDNLLRGLLAAGRAARQPQVVDVAFGLEALPESLQPLPEPRRQSGQG